MLLTTAAAVSDGPSGAAAVADNPSLFGRDAAFALLDRESLPEAGAPFLDVAGHGGLAANSDGLPAVADNGLPAAGVVGGQQSLDTLIPARLSSSPWLAALDDLYVGLTEDAPAAE
jgi:hypothetical protein